MKKNYIFILLLAFCFSNLSFGQEMILNGDFENWDDDTTPTSWTKVENTTKESTEIHGGSFSAKHVGGTKDLGQTIEGVIAGNSYTMTLWYKVTGGDDTNARIWSYWKNAEGSSVTDAATDASLRGGSSSGYLDNNGGAWTKYEVTVTAPAEVTKLYFELRTYSGATVYYDDLSFVNNTTATDPCTTDATQSAAGVAAFDLTMGSALTAIGDGTTFEIIDNPDFDNAVNTSCKVGKVTKLGAQNWDNTQIDFASKFDFSTTNAITIKVWSAEADTEVRIKLEEIGNPDNNLEKFQTTSVTSGWEELTFEYTSANSDKYNKFVIFFNLNGGDSNTYYFDDLKMTTVTDPCTTDATQSAAGVAAFDLTMGSALTVIEDGTTFEIIDNPDFDNAVNTSCKVGKVTKAGAQNWDNTQIDFASKFDFSTTNAITIKVWSAEADTEVRIKLEEIGNPDNNLEKFQTTSVTSGWEELTFEYTSANSDKYNKFVIFFNLNAGDSNTYYFDDLKLTTVTDPCTTDATQSAAGVAAFDLTMGSALTVIEDGTSFEIIDNPDFDNAVNTSCKVGKVTKAGAQNWDNTQIDFASKFDFSTTNAITIKVWSAEADTEVRIKLEEIGNPDNNLEKFQTTSVTSGWEELTFEYTSADSNKFNKFVIFFNLNAGDSNTYYFDDLKLSTTTDACTTDGEQSAAGVAAFDLTMGSALTVIEDGTSFEIIDNPDFDNAVNTSCKVGKITKAGAQNWDNTQIDFASKFDFSTTNAITIKVWSAQADTEVRIKLEEIGNPDNNLEKFQTTSVTSGWEELTFEYASADSNKFDKFVIFFNLNGGDSNTYYFDDLKLVETGGTSDGDYCEKVVAHLGLSDQAASEIKLTVVNSGEKSMKVTIESNNDDAVDFILIPGDVTGSPTQSDVDESVAGKMSITLTWPETAPTDVVFNLLWSKLSTAGNWQLGDAPTTFKFDATCATASIDDKLLVSFSMYPNPASNSLNISASSMIKNAVIYNILGKQVMNLSINKNSESINVSNLASGMYLIKYTTESAIGTAKFIKK